MKIKVQLEYSSEGKDRDESVESMQPMWQLLIKVGDGWSEESPESLFVMSPRQLQKQSDPCTYTCPSRNVMDFGTNNHTTCSRTRFSGTYNQKFVEFI